MTHVEFQGWKAYYALHPFDDAHRFHRPAALVARSMAGGEMQPYVDFLTAPAMTEVVAAHGNYSEADLRTFQAFGMKPPRSQ